MLKGKVHKYGVNINTDFIIPARYLNVSDPAELAKHCMEDLDTEFVKKVQPLPVLESDEAVDNTKSGDTLEVDLATGTIKNISNGKTFIAKPYPEFMSEIIAAGGLIEYTKKRLVASRRA